MIDSQEPARQPLPLALEGGDFFCFFLTLKPRLAQVFPLTYADYFLRHDILMIFMGKWVIVNWWVWPVPDFHFRKLEAMEYELGGDRAVIIVSALVAILSSSTSVSKDNTGKEECLCRDNLFFRAPETVTTAKWQMSWKENSSLSDCGHIRG